jgi:sec-independent protein translocase protein TatC
MTTASEPQTKNKTETSSKSNVTFDPDEFRMTIGEHLEDLRKRLIYGIIGLFAAIVVCMTYGEKVLTIFCAPLIAGLKAHDMTPMLYQKGLQEGFMTYLQISIIAAVIVSAPWIVYQIWLFVAAGLYPKERKAITRYIPLSITLIISGILFVYFLVLPLTIGFFLGFTSRVAQPGPPPPRVETNVPILFTTVHGDPINPPDGAVWFNDFDNRLKAEIHGKLRVLMFGPENLINPQVNLEDYVNFVLMFMLVFAVAFQLPLVMLAVVSIGIIDIDFLKKQRRIVWFVMTIVAAVIAPGDVVTSMMALLIPLIFLYEFGIWLAHWGEKRRQREFDETA